MFFCYLSKTVVSELQKNEFDVNESIYPGLETVFKKSCRFSRRDAKNHKLMIKSLKNKCYK